ncbi:MAG: ceramidase domain-containing protein [Paracoccaceae bacterium]
MDWSTPIDAYCERLGPAFWAEPLNALTNLAFLVAAFVMWQRAAGVIAARLLCVILALIGIGSFLFHTFATPWAGMADVVPIAVFILVYLFLVNRDFVGFRGWKLWGATLAFFPYAAVMVPILNAIPFLRISSFYWTVPILLGIYGFALRARMPETVRGMWIGAGILALSITLRSLDAPLCAVFPVGTHIFWHLLNGVMLGWMIQVYLRAMQGAGLGKNRAPR